MPSRRGEASHIIKGAPSSPSRLGLARHESSEDIRFVLADFVQAVKSSVGWDGVPAGYDPRTGLVRVFANALITDSELWWDEMRPN